MGMLFVGFAGDVSITELSFLGIAFLLVKKRGDSNEIITG
jgi:hypothetical protein